MWKKLSGRGLFTLVLCFTLALLTGCGAVKKSDDGQLGSEVATIENEAGNNARDANDANNADRDNANENSDDNAVDADARNVDDTNNNAVSEVDTEAVTLASGEWTEVSLEDIKDRAQEYLQGSSGTSYGVTATGGGKSLIRGMSREYGVVWQIVSGEDPLDPDATVHLTFSNPYEYLILSTAMSSTGDYAALTLESDDEESLLLIDVAEQSYILVELPAEDIVSVGFLGDRELLVSQGGTKNNAWLMDVDGITFAMQFEEFPALELTFPEL
jgi:hypothetical protein